MFIIMQVYFIVVLCQTLIVDIPDDDQLTATCRSLLYVSTNVAVHGALAVAILVCTLFRELRVLQGPARSQVRFTFFKLYVFCTVHRDAHM